MAQDKKPLTNYARGITSLIVLLIALYLILTNLGVFGNILLVGLGFGAVIMIHEFGHFIVARLSGIKIEQFAIGFPPVLFGIRKTQRGWKVRVLPKFFPKENDPTGEGALGFTIGSPENPSETEYRIGLVPFGGYVKMLGQEDVGKIEATTDPRSFANKSLLTKCAVVAAGVFFNAVSAVIFFMIAFTIGVKLPAPIVGDVIPGSPAAQAGIKPGDRVLEVNGETDITFMEVILAGALSDVNEDVPLKVRHLDGTEEKINVKAAKLPGSEARLPRSFGIDQGRSLTLANVREKEGIDPNLIKYKELGFKPGDTVTAVNGTPVEYSFQYEKAFKDNFNEAAKLTVHRQSNGSTSTLDIDVPLEFIMTPTTGLSETDLSHLGTMVPYLTVAVPPSKSIPERIINALGFKTQSLEEGDLITRVGDVNGPTFAQLRQVVNAHSGKSLELAVLRKNKEGGMDKLVITARPKAVDPNKAMIGFNPGLALDYPYLAATINTADVNALAIPAGSKIVSVAGTPVSNWRDIAMAISNKRGQSIDIAYIAPDGNQASVSLSLPAKYKLPNIASVPEAILPFKDLRETYKASGPLQAIAMGYDATIMFIGQTYVTLKGLIVGLISPKALMGPAGILKVSYMIVSERMWTFYIYFIGLISASIAVMNFLPFPILDGGVIVMMIIEKIKGSPIDPKIQGYISYIGLVLIAAFFLWVTWNDLTNVFFK